MRKLYRSIKITKLLVLSLALSASVLAKTPRGVVSAIKGNVFVTTQGQTKKLDTGDYLYDFDQIFTEVGAQLSFRDYHDHQYHLSGSAHASILNQMIDLKGGYLWVQTQETSEQQFHIQTVNATVSYTHGEFIISYNMEDGKSQLLSVDGTHLFKNNIQEFLKEEVSTGMFSFITEEYENGAPRIPTPVGSKAYTTALSLFDDVRPSQGKLNTSKKNRLSPPVDLKNKSRSRAIASVETSHSSSEGSIIVLKKADASKDKKYSKSLMSYYKNKVSKLSKDLKKKPKKFKPSYSKKTGVTVKVFGQKKSRGIASVKTEQVKTPKKTRKPASMMELNPQVTIKKNAFESSLLQEYKKQMRHSKDINNLIQELKSYDQDYKQAY